MFNEEFKNMNNKTFVEYVWLDGYATQNLRSKTKVLSYSIEVNGPLKLTDIPDWNFDGSSTEQAPGSESECILKPVRLYTPPHGTSVMALCEVYNVDGSPHKSNMRSHLRDCVAECEGNSQFWWGFEQEYFMMRDGAPVGFPKNGFPKAQGEFYCGVGNANVKHRDIAEFHMYECLELGIEITGINVEVALGQWEYQCFGNDTLKACDDLWISRYLLHKMTEQYYITVNMDPKPVKGDWNGSGCHTNFSNRTMRDEGSERYFQMYLSNLNRSHQLHIENYGENNDQRLTGHHETQHITEFSYGIGDRGASIRIPHAVKENDWKGYLEDRRPASNCDPYKVAKLIIGAAP